MDLQAVLALEAQGKTAYARDAFLEARDFYEQALHLREQMEQENAELVPLLTTLGEIAQTLEHEAQAEAYYRRALAICETTYGAGDVRTIRSVGDVAGILDQAGKQEQAQALYEEAVSGAEQYAGSAHPDTALALSKLARFYRVIGKFEQSEQLFGRALAIYEQLPPEKQDKQMAISLNNYAYLQLQLSRYPEAETLLRRALQLNANDERSLRVAANLKNLAQALRGQDQAIMGRICGEYALALYEQLLGSEHSDTVAAAIALGYNKARDLS